MSLSRVGRQVVNNRHNPAATWGYIYICAQLFVAGSLMPCDRSGKHPNKQSADNKMGRCPPKKKVRTRAPHSKAVVPVDQGFLQYIVNNPIPRLLELALSALIRGTSGGP